MSRWSITDISHYVPPGNGNGGAPRDLSAVLINSLISMLPGPTPAPRESTLMVIPIRVDPSGRVWDGVSWIDTPGGSAAAAAAAEFKLEVR